MCTYVSIYFISEFVRMKKSKLSVLLPIMIRTTGGIQIMLHKLVLGDTSARIHF